MQKLIYKPTGAEVTAPNGIEMPADLFEPVSVKPKVQKARRGKTDDKKVEKEA